MNTRLRPLALLLSGWGAGALMILLLAYSILLATRTAVAEVPARLRDLAAHLSGERPEGEAGRDDRLLEGTESQSSLGRPLGEKGKRARDDARVVPEEQTAKGRDGADGEQALIDPLTV